MSTSIEVLPGGTEHFRTPPAREVPGPVLVIEPSGRFPRINFGELWAYRGLFFFMVWRDVKVRYAQTALGAGWAVLQPVLTMVIFSIIFGRLAKLPSNGVPYPVFALAALVPWTYFSSALTAASNSLVSNTSLITKIYFPRLVIPFGPVLAGLLDFGIAFALLLAAVFGFGMVPSAAALVMVPLLVLIMVAAVAGAGCWLAALHLRYRDVRLLIPFVLQIWLFASPVVYPASMVPPAYRLLYALNPLAGVIEGLRAVLFGNASIPWDMIGVSAAVSAFLLVAGVLYFRHTERVFADLA